MRSLVLVVSFLVTILPNLASAHNNVNFVNHCPYDVYSWTVGPAGSGFEGKDHEVVSIPANSVTVYSMVNGEAIGGGITIKLRDLPKYRVAPAGIIQVEYNLEPSKNNLWYDLSAVDCNYGVGPENPSYCPFIAGGIKVSVENAHYGRCPPAWCGAGSCHNTYKEHGFWQGEPTFRCDAGTDILVEFCTERAGPRTFDGHTEPGHPADPDSKPGEPTTNGVCGARTPGGATCFGYAYGACCSSYGWCGGSEAHCGEGCQAGFGDCFGQPVQPFTYTLPAKPSSIYQPLAQPSTVKSSYSRPTPSYTKPTPSYYPPTSSPIPPKHTHIEHTWPSYSRSTESSTMKSTLVYSKPTTTFRLTPSYYPPVSSHTTPAKTTDSSVYTSPPSHSKSTPVYSKPTSSYVKPNNVISTFENNKPSTTSRPVYSTPPPAFSKPTSTYSAPTHSVLTGYTPPYSLPPYRTVYATHTVTEIRAQITKTVTVSIGSGYSVPTPSMAYSTPTTSSVYRTPTPVYHTPSSIHTQQQEPFIPPSWHNKPGTSSAYHEPTPTGESYDVPTLSVASYATGPAYYPLVVSESYSAPTSFTAYYPPAGA